MFHADNDICLVYIWIDLFIKNYLVLKKERFTKTRIFSYYATCMFHGFRFTQKTKFTFKSKKISATDIRFIYLIKWKFIILPFDWYKDYLISNYFSISFIQYWPKGLSWYEITLAQNISEPNKRKSSGNGRPIFQNCYINWDVCTNCCL